MATNKYNGMKYARDWVGKRVQLTRDVGTGVSVVPKGYVGVITMQGSTGLSFEGEGCKCCGIRPRITRLGYNSVQLVD